MHLKIVPAIAWIVICSSGLSAQVFKVNGNSQKQQPVLATMENGEHISLVFINANTLNFQTNTKSNVAAISGKLVGTTASSGQKMIGAVAIEQHKDADRRAVFSIFENDGRLHHTISLTHGFDDPVPQFVVNDLGKCVAVRPDIAGATFFNASGERIKKTDLFAETKHALERKTRAIFSPNGETLTIAAMRQPASPNNPFRDENSVIFLYTSAGELLWQRTVALQDLQQIAFSPDGQRIAVSTMDAYAASGNIEKSTQIFNSEGQLLTSFPIGFETGIFSNENRRFLAVEKRSAALFDLSENRLITEIKAERNNLFLDAQLHTSGRAFVLIQAESFYTATGFLHRNATLRFFGQTGEPLFEARFASEHFASAMLIQNETALAVVTSRETAIYQWPEAN